MANDQDLAGLPKYVREAWRKVRYATEHTRGTVIAPTPDMELIFDHHLRLARENAELTRALTERLDICGAAVQRAERAEAELAALKQRIAEAATGVAKRSLAPGCLVIEGFDDDPSDFHNERVALLPVGGE